MKTYYKSEEIYIAFDSTNFYNYVIYHTSFNILHKHRHDLDDVKKFLKCANVNFKKFRMVTLANVKNMSSTIYKK